MDSKLTAFFSDIANAVSPVPTASERQGLCVLISDFLKNEENRKLFAALCVDPRRVVFEDPRSKLCVVSHLFEGAKNGLPHDHGSTWSIYAQVTGLTEMTHYRVMTPPEGDNPGVVMPELVLALKPGTRSCTKLDRFTAPVALKRRGC